MSIRDELETLKESIEEVTACLLMDSSGRAVSCNVEDEEALAFKLAVLFLLDGFEEMLIERREGASYVKLHGHRMVYLEFSGMPSIPLINMYIKRLFERRKPEAKPEPREEAVEQERRVEEGEVLATVAEEYVLSDGRSTGEIANELRDRLRVFLEGQPRVRGGRVVVAVSVNEGVLEFFVHVNISYQGGILGRRDRSYERELTSMLRELAEGAAAKIGEKLNMKVRVKCTVEMNVKR